MLAKRLALAALNDVLALPPVVALTHYAYAVRRLVR